MKTNLETESSIEIVELSPNYRIPIFLFIAACVCSTFSIWLGVVIAFLSLFLAIQTILIRLQFTDQALNILRSGKQILSFPYNEWLNWEVYWSPVPILFYFKEINSIHFLPIIFDPKTLINCLNNYQAR